VIPFLFPENASPWPLVRKRTMHLPILYTTLFSDRTERVYFHFDILKSVNKACYWSATLRTSLAVYSTETRKHLVPYGNTGERMISW
jgi:hypothetical protein